MAEEFLLLCFDDQTGKKIISSDKIEPALGGALLVELALKERIGVTSESAGWRQRGRLTITDTTPTDDLELDSALAKLQAAEGKKIKDLISKMSGKRITKGLRTTAARAAGGKRCAAAGARQGSGHLSPNDVADQRRGPGGGRTGTAAHSTDRRLDADRTYGGADRSAGCDRAADQGRAERGQEVLTPPGQGAHPGGLDSTGGQASDRGGGSRRGRSGLGCRRCRCGWWKLI